MKHPLQKLGPDDFPRLIKEIPDPPEQLYLRGTLPDESEYAFLCVVGSRKYTAYGKRAIQDIIAGLRGYPIVIVSGLALGIDSIAHKAALKADLTTLAVPGSGLHDTVLYPRSHVKLAHSILKHNGALLSEFEPDFKAKPWSFPQRNRIMAGMCSATLVVEATQKSGTLITARLAAEYHRDVFTIPGSIFSDNTAGNHMLLKKGAALIRSADDIIAELRLTKQSSSHHTQKNLLENTSKSEKRVLQLLTSPQQRDSVIRSLDMPTHKANSLLATMEVKGLITEENGKIYAVQR